MAAMTPPARPALRARYEQRQREVVAAAAKLFAENGYQATSIADLTEATGLAAGGLYARLILGVGVRDLTGGFKCIHRRVLEAIDLPSLRAEGYVFQIEVTYRAVLAGFTVKEVPIVFADRTAGKSKMSARIALEAMLLVPAIRRDAASALRRAGRKQSPPRG